MRIPPALSYSVRRIALFVVTMLFLTVVLPGASPILVLALATIVSAFLSYFLLAGPRKEMARSVEARVKGLSARLDAGAKAEDAAIDAAEEAARRSAGRPAAPQENAGPQ